MGFGLFGSGWKICTTRRWWPARCLPFIAIGLSSPASASPVALELAWRAAPGCPDRTTVRRYVDEMLGSAEPATSFLNARGSVLRAAPDRWIADLTLRSAAGTESTRTFEGPTCESVSRAAALVVALAIHPNELPPSPAAASSAERDTTPSARPVVGRFRRPEAAAATALAVGSTPGPAYGVSVAFGWFYAGIRWEPSAAYFFKGRGTLAGRESLGADFTLAALGLRGCYPVLDVAVSLAPCFGGGVDWLRGSGFGARNPDEGSAFTTNVRAGGLITWNFTDLVSARLEVEGLFSFTRPEFVIDSAGTVYHPPGTALRGLAGLELHF